MPFSSIISVSVVGLYLYLVVHFWVYFSLTLTQTAYIKAINFHIISIFIAVDM